MLPDRDPVRGDKPRSCVEDAPLSSSAVTTIVDKEACDSERFRVEATGVLSASKLLSFKLSFSSDDIGDSFNVGMVDKEGFDADSFDKLIIDMRLPKLAGLAPGLIVIGLPC